MIDGLHKNVGSVPTSLKINQDSPVTKLDKASCFHKLVVGLASPFELGSMSFVIRSENRASWICGGDKYPVCISSFSCKQMRGLDLELRIASNLSEELMSEKKHVLTLEWQTSNTSKYMQ